MIIPSKTHFYDSELGHNSYYYVGEKHLAISDIEVEPMSSLVDPERLGFTPYLVSMDVANEYKLSSRLIWI